MKKQIIRILLLSLLFTNYCFTEEVKFYNPSFNCTNVEKNSIEFKICTDRELAKLDLTLASTYKEVTNINNVNQEKIKLEQRQWIENRNNCSNLLCLTQQYNQIIQKLKLIIVLVKKDKIPFLRKIKVADPDISTEKIEFSYRISCQSFSSKQKPVTLSKDKNLYVINKLSYKEVPQNSFYWKFRVSDILYDKTNKKQIFAGYLTIWDGRTYDFDGIILYTYSKDWNCKLNKFGE